MLAQNWYMVSRSYRLRFNVLEMELTVWVWFYYLPQTLIMYEWLLTSCLDKNSNLDSMVLVNRTASSSLVCIGRSALESKIERVSTKQKTFWRRVTDWWMATILFEVSAHIPLVGKHFSQSYCVSLLIYMCPFSHDMMCYTKTRARLLYTPCFHYLCALNMMNVYSVLGNFLN